MKKYFFIFKSEIMSNFQYIFNMIGSFIGHLVMLFILFNLFKYIYSDPSEIINGYSMNQMIWYVIFTEMLWGIVGGRRLAKTISNDVRSGNITYNINKPYNYIGYSLSNQLANMVIKSIIYVILCLTLGFILLGSFPNLNIIEFILILITALIGITINSLFIICIGLFSFKIEDSSPFYWVYSKFLLIIGTLFPIEFFPKIIRPIIKFSPIYVMTYGPAKLFVSFSYTLFIKVILAQIIYLFIAYGLATIIYKKGVKNLNVNGG